MKNNADKSHSRMSGFFMTSIEKAILYEVSLLPPATLAGRARVKTTLFE